MMQLLEWNNRLQLHSLCIAHGLQSGTKTQEKGRRMCAELLHETKSQQTCHSSDFYIKNSTRIRAFKHTFTETQRNVLNCILASHN